MLTDTAHQCWLLHTLPNTAVFLIILTFAYLILQHGSSLIFFSCIFSKTYQKAEYLFIHLLAICLSPFVNCPESFWLFKITVIEESAQLHSLEIQFNHNEET